jgi:prepilin-type N-terminal cleavage/methylation domain-containing protein
MFNILLVKLKETTDNRGFTFIEVLVVLAIFSIGVLGVAVMQVTSMGTNASARMSGEATALATNQVEALMALPYDDDDLDPATNPHAFNQGAYTINWNVTDSDFDGDGTNDSKTIIVTVSCANPNAKDISIQYIKPEA